MPHGGSSHSATLSTTTATTASRICTAKSPSGPSRVSGDRRCRITTTQARTTVIKPKLNSSTNIPAGVLPVCRSWAKLCTVAGGQADKSTLR